MNLTKNILIALILSVCFSVYGQDHVLRNNQSEYSFTGSKTDSIGDGANDWNYELYKQGPTTVTPYIYFEIDTTGDGSNDLTKIYLDGKVFEEEAYTVIDSVYFYSTTDTSFIMNLTGYYKYRYWQQRVEGSTDDVHLKIKKINFNLLY